ncbi:hypothetical protein D3C75_669880 [compost metagenome]
MIDPDAERKQALLDIINDPATDEQTKLDCRKEMLDLEDPELVAELAQRYAEEALELMKEEARTAKDSDVRRKAREVVEHYEQARQAHIRRRDSK